MAKLAWLMGISEYQPGLNALPGAVQNVKAMQRVLQHSEMGDFADADIIDRVIVMSACQNHSNA